MSAHRYQVIATHANGTMSVWPQDGKDLSYKNGQRLANELVQHPAPGLDGGMEVKKARVVEAVLELHP